MLKINRDAVALERLSVKTLAEANILERKDLQQMILKDPEPFFEEMGEKLVIVGQEVNPSDLVGDSIDILAIDQLGVSVIIELKRAEQKLQLLQALSYAAMLSDWEAQDFVDQRSRFATETVSEAMESIKDHIAGTATDQLNGAQRVILVAEKFDYALLRTAEWLTETYGANIHCYRLRYALDGGAEYLSCTRVYPPPEIVDQASRARRPGRLNVNQAFTSWKSVFETIQNPAVLQFFQDELAAGCESRVAGKEIYYRVRNQRRFGICARRKHAWVWQKGRFDNDVSYWLSVLSDPKVQELSDGLSFQLFTAKDFDAFKSALQNKLNTTDISGAEPSISPDDA